MKKIVLFLVVFNVVVVFAQQQNLPLNREFNLLNQKVFNQDSNTIHTSFLPINQSFIKTDIQRPEGDENFLINISKEEKRERSWVIRKMFFENFLIVDTGNFYLTIDPLLNIEMGKDSKDTSGTTLYKNTRGIIVRGNVGEKFSFETSLYENQMVLPNYQADYVNSTGVVPGQGRVKRFKGNGFDFSSSSAVVTYSPSKTFNFQLGTSKHFVGDGYRSLLLSDASFNYPFIKIINTFGKQDQFQYTKLNAILSSVTRREKGSTAEALFVRKSMSTHYLSWLATKWLNVGLFESTLWHTEDSSGTKPYQFQQLNPIIGINALTTVTDEVNHSNVGLNLKFKLPHDMIVYGQVVMDGNQYEKMKGYQFGARISKIKGLTIQGEYNMVDNPYATTFNQNLEVFTNYGESLAHPLGSNFTEFVGIINYKYKRVFLQAKLIMRNAIDETVQIGYATTIPGSETNSMITQFHLGYIINPKNNMSIFAGITERSWGSELETSFVYFGFRTNLRNLYYDF